MPRYFFDTVADEQASQDEVGLELPDDVAARRHVGTFVPDVARNGLSNGDVRTFECTARNEAGEAIYTIALTYRGRRTGPRTP